MSNYTYPINKMYLYDYCDWKNTCVDLDYITLVLILIDISFKKFQLN